MKLVGASVLLVTLLRCASAYLLRAPLAALHVAERGGLLSNGTASLRDQPSLLQSNGTAYQPALLQSRGAGTEEAATGAMVMELLNGKVSMREVMRHIDERMNIDEAMNRLQGKLPGEVAALVGSATRVQAGQTPDPIFETIKPDGNIFRIPKEAQSLNWTANITAVAPSDGKFQIDFLTGGTDVNNIAFSLEPSPSVCIRNANLGGVWGSPETSGGALPIKAGAKFELRIYRGPTKYEITVDGKRLEVFDFVHRTQKIPTAIRVGYINEARVDLLGYQTPGKLSEDSIQTARKILNGMIETSYKEMDDITIECQAFKDSNRRTFDQIVTDIARLGSESANLDKVIASALACTADQDVQFKAVKDTYSKEQNLYLKTKAEQERLLRLKRNDLAVFDFILDATKCPPDASATGTPKLFLQTNKTARDALQPSVCAAHEGGFELKFDDPKVEATILSELSDDAKVALREALGLALSSTSHAQAPMTLPSSDNDESESEEADSLLQINPAAEKLPPLTGQHLLMSLEHQTNHSYSPNTPFACHRYEEGAFPTNDDACRRAGTVGNTEYKFVGAAGAGMGPAGCGPCWCCKRPRACTVTLYEHDGFGGWAARYPEGVYNYPDILSRGARNDEVSSLKVDGPCVAILFEHYLWQGWSATFKEGSYDMRAFMAAGGRNDQTSSLIVFPEGYIAAKKACESVYGQCEIGQCGNFFYFYDKNSKSCNCDKPAGQQEFIFKNTGYTRVGADYYGGPAQDDVIGEQLFRRVKALSGCQAGVWKLGGSLVPTTTPPPAPTPPPVPVKAAPKPAQRFKRCTAVKDDAGVCGLLHDTMSLQWGKYKDEVDVLEADMHKNQDLWNKLSEDLMEQLRLITGTKTVCQAKFSESTSSKNVLVEESKEKEIQKKTVTKDYDHRMKECKTQIEELLFTDICAVRTVRNKLMEQSAVTPPEEIVDCEVDDWVAGECSKKCDDGCPHMVGREIDPFKCGGTQRLVRNAIVANNANGFRCPPLTRSMRCGQYKCSVDCKLSQWSGWSKCSKECEGGVQTQTRSIITKPRFGGSACASTVDSRACNTMSCDRDCTLADWSKWSSCSVSCNPGGLPGTQERTRRVLVPIRGEGKCPKDTHPTRYEHRGCNEQPCRGDEVCVATQDLIIAIDASGSLRQSGFDTLKAFAQKLVSKYQSKYLGATAVRIGIILFGNGAKGGNGGSILPAINIQPLTEDLNLVTNKLKTITWQKGFTNMAQAFVLADTMFTEKGRGGSAQSAVIMLSDGRYSFAFETDNAVKKLKEKATKIYMAPISSNPGAWEAKIKSWASQPWQSHFNRIPGFGVLGSNMDFFVNELVARFCPESISPSAQEGKDDAKGYMIVRKNGLPNLDCAKWYDLGFVNRPGDCMLKVVQEMGLKAFAVSEKMQQGRKCLAEDMKFTKTQYLTWRSAKTDIPCPGGAWEGNSLYTTYAIQPMQEDHVESGNQTTSR